MSEPEPENEFMKRGFLLPKGCKNLSGVINECHPVGVATWQSTVSGKNITSVVKEDPPYELQKPWKPNYPADKPLKYAPANLAESEMVEFILPDPISVGTLVIVLGAAPHQIIADLMNIGISATLKTILSFSEAAKIARLYGILTKKGD